MSGKTVAELAAEQAAFWKGAGGEGWLAAYQRIQRALGELSELTLAAADARDGEQAIDIGCGTGDTTAALAAAVGLRGHVLDIDDNPIPGLYAAGELIGGLWYFNYPGSAGLMAGAVFGRLAGREAGEFALKS